MTCYFTSKAQNNNDDDENNNNNNAPELVLTSSTFPKLCFKHLHFNKMLERLKYP